MTDLLRQLSENPPSPIAKNVADLFDEDAIAYIKQWVFDNFDRPKFEAPYSQIPGGAIFRWGGPYSTREIVECFFGDLIEPDVLETAVAEIELVGMYQWARLLDRSDDDSRRVSRKTDVLHETMSQRLTALEAALMLIPAEPPGIGHNHPPEPLYDRPLTAQDLADIRGAVELLKAQPVEPENVLPQAKRAVATLELLSGKVGKYLAEKGDLFITEAAKSAGSEVGKWAVKGPVWITFGAALFEAAKAAAEWLNAIMHSF